jgi:hypothetical protein
MRIEQAVDKGIRFAPRVLGRERVARQNDLRAGAVYESLDDPPVRSEHVEDPGTAVQIQDRGLGPADARAHQEDLHAIDRDRVDGELAAHPGRGFRGLHAPVPRDLAAQVATVPCPALHAAQRQHDIVDQPGAYADAGLA